MNLTPARGLAGLGPDGFTAGEPGVCLRYRANPLPTLLLSLSLALWPHPVAAGEASLWCTYQLLTYAHEAVTFCGEPVDDKQKAIYEEARTNLKRFINENARLEVHKVKPGLDDEARSTWRNKGQAQFCQSFDYSGLKKFLTEALTTEAIVKLRKRLEIPADPAEGDCL